MAADALAYAVVVAAGTVVLAVVLGVATGGGLVRAKVLSFLAGWLFLAVATVRLWPRSPVRADDASTGASPVVADVDEPTHIEAIAEALPPLRWMHPPPRRLSPPTKLFVGAVFVLLASLLLEVVFTVG